MQPLLVSHRSPGSCVMMLVEVVFLLQVLLVFVSCQWLQFVLMRRAHAIRCSIFKKAEHCLGGVNGVT